MEFKSCKCKSNKLPDSFHNDVEKHQNQLASENTRTDSETIPEHTVASSKRVSIDLPPPRIETVSTDSKYCCRCGVALGKPESGPPTAEAKAPIKKSEEKACCNSALKKKKSAKEEFCCTCGAPLNKDSKKKDQKKKEEPKKKEPKKSKKKDQKGSKESLSFIMCGKKKKSRSSLGSECACGSVDTLDMEGIPPMIQPRHHGSACVMEFNIMEKHTEGCAHKKTFNGNPEDKVGSYDVIGRVVYPVCAGTSPNLKGSTKGLTLNDPNIFGAATEEPRSRVPSMPYLPPCNDCIPEINPDVQGRLCDNPRCAWGPLKGSYGESYRTHPQPFYDIPSFSNTCANPNCPSNKGALCKKCADRITKGRTICQNPNCKRSKKNPSQTTMYLGVERDPVDSELERKEKKMMQLRKIMEDAEVAVTLSKSNKSFPRIQGRDSSASLEAEKSGTCSGANVEHIRFRRKNETPKVYQYKLEMKFTESDDDLIELQPNSSSTCQF